MTAWVYILKCADGSYYIGLTTDVTRRFSQHQMGFHDGYTANRRPVQMMWMADFPELHDAYRFEHHIKKWSRRKKEALIEGRYDLLPQLSARGFRPASPDCVVRDAAKYAAPHHDEGGDG